MPRLSTLLTVCLLIFAGHQLRAQVSLEESALIFSTDQTLAIGDSSVLFTIRDISIAGNKRTRDATILRELSFGKDQAYPLSTIISKFTDAKEQLMNTGLFRNVVVSLRSLRDRDVYVRVDVEEKWYFYPLPFVKVVDNKFSKWWNDKHHELDQLNYGIRFTQYNLSGRNDKLFIYLMDGYTKQIVFNYNGLNLDKDLKWYTNLTVATGKQRDVNYVTLNNKQVSVRGNDEYLHRFTTLQVDVTYRPAIKTRHTFSVGYNYDVVADTIFRLNQNFSSTENALRYPIFAYTFSYSNLDFIPYPTKGFASDISISKAGINAAVNLWQLTAKATTSWHLDDKNFFNLKAVGLIKLPFKQPYIRQQFIGYDDLFLQGYENYVIDGVAGGYVKASIFHPVLTSFIKVPTNKLTDKFKLATTIPVKIYAKLFADMGYVHNSNNFLYNPLNDKMLYSAGVGLDIIAFADLVIKIEWSFNAIGQNGLYLHQHEKY